MAIRLLQVLRRRLPGGAKVRSGLGVRRATDGVSGTSGKISLAKIAKITKVGRGSLRNFFLAILVIFAREFPVQRPILPNS
jgi:hypothetical protein